VEEDDGEHRDIHQAKELRLASQSHKWSKRLTLDLRLTTAIIRLIILRIRWRFQGLSVLLMASAVPIYVDFCLDWGRGSCESASLSLPINWDLLGSLSWYR
jgi:hypothetical protein